MDALRHIKRITGQRQKVGHGGTMDPLARGVLPVSFGQATRLMDHVIGGMKIYRAEITLGITTTTYDAEGEIVNTIDMPDLTLDMVKEKIEPWVGLVNQTPPIYSAIKVDGKRLYELARAGINIDIEHKTRPVEIRGIKILKFDYPKLTIKVECGKGTYIRSLAHDLGESLGCGGHISDLVRLFCGSFPIDESVTLEQIEEAVGSPESWRQHLYHIDRVLLHLKSITLGSERVEQLRHGQAVSLDSIGLKSEHLEVRRAYTSQGNFLALVKFDRNTDSWKPDKVFHIDTLSPYAPTA